MKQIVANTVKGIGQIGVETVEKAVEESGKIVDTVITGRELLGDVKPMGEGEYMKRKGEDEQNRQKEIDDLKDQIGRGRNLEKEIKDIRDMKKQEEEQKEKEFLENLKRQREAEEVEREAMAGVALSNPHKAKKSRGSAFVHGKKKKSMPDMQQLSQTGEIKGKID